MIINAKVIGVRPIHYTNNAGREVNGLQVHFSYPDSQVSGEACMNVFVSRSQLGDRQLKLGEQFQLAYDRYHINRNGQPYVEFLG